MGTRHWPEDADDEVERLEGIITALRQRVAELEEVHRQTVDKGVAGFEALVKRVQELEKERDELIHEVTCKDHLVTELDKERDSAYKIADHYRAERDELLKAVALAMPVMDAHAGPSRLADFHAAIASVKEKA